jgi:hypothetical protein
MQQSELRKLLLARRLYDLARENLHSSNDLSLMIGISLLQDSVESFLLAVAEHVNAAVGARTAFEQYFDLIDEKRSPEKLPFRARLLTLNRLRVGSKHHAIPPAGAEVEGMLVTVREFFKEITRAEFDVDFATISMIDLLKDTEAKEFLKAAEEAFKKHDYRSCLIACRKAVYVEIERSYDVFPFGLDEPGRDNLAGYFFGLTSTVPFFARNKEYIDKNVTDPTQYIVLDHNKVELELMKAGVDTVAFWNVWRLTPEVYQKRDSKEWIVKHDLGKLEDEGIDERAGYVLDATVSILVTRERHQAAHKSSDSAAAFFLDLIRDQIPVHRKADSNSEVVMTTPVGITRLNVDFSVVGLTGQGEFWHVAHIQKGGPFVWGYISAEFVKSD